MILEHLNLVVRDINTTLKFYQAAFPHWKIRTSGKSTWYGVERRWVHFGEDYQYLTFNDNGRGDNRDLSSHSIGLAHFAYSVRNLDALIQRMEKAGYPVDKHGPENPYRRNVYYLDPNGFEVEFVEYFSDLPSQRNNEM